MTNSLVEILISTYNGEKYLKAQLNSIFKQDYTNWRLLIRDDGSTDSTLSILNDYVQKHPDKIQLLNDTEGNIGYSNSFSKLLKQSSANYVMYCDQDDYWYPCKISSMLSVMLEEEARLPAKAHMVFSDLEVADSELKVNSPSFLRLMRYSSRKDMQIFFLKNYAPGCNLLFNRILIQSALKTDNVINLHDHWLLMVCSSVGEVSFINKPLMRYRMHANNAIGFIEQHSTFIKRVSLSIKSIVKYGLSNAKYRDLLYRKNIQQMKNICECLPTLASKEAFAFSMIGRSTYLRRKIKNIRKPYILERSLLKQITYIICF